ncbi:hypothetical protein PHYPSEUDO_010233 [Phytophthora pseudosyringae]|uniref:Uncharacterized protein n=1 Tax=Phytophthora pseudosyringae TaxID=221518 RepID=A0A8T1VDQ5_9STRA|nr:hypothetical protein PHYPSEUDO_010233 [Phytophthora pseudosyringae]
MAMVAAIDSYRRKRGAEATQQTVVSFKNDTNDKISRAPTRFRGLAGTTAEPLGSCNCIHAQRVVLDNATPSRKQPGVEPSGPAEMHSSSRWEGVQLQDTVLGCGEQQKISNVSYPHVVARAATRQVSVCQYDACRSRNRKMHPLAALAPPGSSTFGSPVPSVSKFLCRQQLLMTSSYLVLAALLPALAAAHGSISDPMPTSSDIYNKNAPSGYKSGTPGQYTGAQSIKDLVGASGSTCGNTAASAAAVTAPSNGAVTFDISAVHIGPCELWLDDSLVANANECWTTYADKSIPLGLLRAPLGLAGHAQRPVGDLRQLRQRRWRRHGHDGYALCCFGLCQQRHHSRHRVASQCRDLVLRRVLVSRQRAVRRLVRGQLRGWVLPRVAL